MISEKGIPMAIPRFSLAPIHLIVQILLLRRTAVAFQTRARYKMIEKVRMFSTLSRSEGMKGAEFRLYQYGERWDLL